MKVQAVFLDRDGVINVDGNYVHTIDDFHFIKDSIEAMKLMKEKGYALVVITNQSGIARGLYTEEDFLKLTEWMDWSLMDRGVNLDGVYYCPHHPIDGVGKYKVDCECRKPKPGLYLEAARECDIDLSKSYMVGDRKSDIEAGKNAGLKASYLVKTGKALTEEAISLADEVFADLMAVAKALPNLHSSKEDTSGFGKSRGEKRTDGMVSRDVYKQGDRVYKKPLIDKSDKSEGAIRRKKENSAERTISSVYEKGTGQKNKTSKQDDRRELKGHAKNEAGRANSSYGKKANKTANVNHQNQLDKNSMKNKTHEKVWRDSARDAGFAPLKRAQNKVNALQETEETEE